MSNSSGFGGANVNIVLENLTLMKNESYPYSRGDH